MIQSPENLIFNGIDLAESFTDSAKGTYFIVNNVEGRGVLSEEISTIEVPGMAGAYQSSKYTPTRTLSVSISLKGESFEDLRKKIDRLSSILIKDELVPIKFSDELDVTYYGSLNEVEHKIEVACIYQAVLNFLCTDPFKYEEAQTKTFESDVLSLTYNGTAPASPIFELEVIKPVTFAMVQNQYNEYQMIGQPTNVNEEVVDTRTLILEERGETLDTWQDNPVSVDGNVSGNMGYDGAGITAPTYGTGERWHGPAKIKEVPVSTDFEIEARMQLYTDEINQTGRIEIYLFDENMTELGKVAINDNSIWVLRRLAEGRIGPYVGNFQNYIISSRNYQYEWDNFPAFLRMKRQDKTYEFYVARVDGSGKHLWSLKKSYTVSDSKYLGKLKYVQIHIGKFGDTASPHTSRIDWLRAYVIEDTTKNQTPYIARPGDLITLDNFNKELLINGEDAKNLKDFGGSFFNLHKGENQLIVHPANSFNSRVKWSERYR
ncbi:distal tail protein Dit [Virgibacillus proomii]|uniref:distal tail protein Dit n=1 Tax=Virgibacillus proomii TaxID=84407 RepID=UPI001C0FE712|nr:distal tail protein Dit [Virgibacillus proomii]MBU5266303.1 phage tail family protein [Virgibacillus proomii]